MMLGTGRSTRREITNPHEEIEAAPDMAVKK